MELRDHIISAVKDYSLTLGETQLEQLEKYYELLGDWNKKINLTAITDPEGVAVKHFADSLSLLNYTELKQGARVIDIGTGAGFPGVVLKIARPDIELCLLDSLKKRFLFLNDLLSNLGLDAEFIQGRAEEYGQDEAYRESFDLAVSRAVARLNTLSEYCLPFVRLSGRFVAFKGGDCVAEVQGAKHALSVLGGRLEKLCEFELPCEGGARTLVITEKVAPTPDKYPRSNGKIKSKPL